MALDYLPTDDPVADLIDLLAREAPRPIRHEARAALKALWAIVEDWPRQQSQLGLVGLVRRERTVHLEDVDIDLAACEVRREGQPINLTPIEWAILETLAEQPGVAVRGLELVRYVYGQSAVGCISRTLISTHLARLRKKLCDPNRARIAYRPSNRIIQTVPGIGFRLAMPARTNGRPG